MVELALVMLVVYLVAAVGIELGRMVFSARVIQDAARVAARELALTPLPPAPAGGFDDPVVQAALNNVLDPCRLVVDIDATPDLDALFATFPVVNQMLRAAMIVDLVTIDGAPRRLLRYPGALLRPPAGACTPPVEFIVGIPVVTSRGSDGVETIKWVGVLEEVRPDADACSGPFSLAAPDPVGCPSAPAGQPRGVVALRINYPYQAAALSAYTPRPPTTEDPMPPNLDRPIVAADGGVSDIGTAPGTPLPDDGAVGPYAGPYGLGRQFALAKQVRPFRKLLAAQAVFRREIFE
jgi:hypothetical protein